MPIVPLLTIYQVLLIIWLDMLEQTKAPNSIICAIKKIDQSTVPKSDWGSFIHVTNLVAIHRLFSTILSGIELKTTLK